jgi:multidrug efflux pump
MSANDAIVQACLLRFCPIDDHAGGLVRRAAAGGESGTGKLRFPTGYIDIGGLLLSQLRRSISPPVIYLALDRLNAGSRRRCHWRNLNCRCRRSPSHRGMQ